MYSDARTKCPIKLIIALVLSQHDFFKTDKAAIHHLFDLIIYATIERGPEVVISRNRIPCWMILVTDCNSAINNRHILCLSLYE